MLLASLFSGSRGALITVLCALGVTVSCQRAAGPSAPALRPLNVVVVTIDTLRPDHVHCYGYEKIETPTLDRIAQGGALFENAVAQVPLTPPSHASIFTGVNPPTHKVRDIGGFFLSPSTPTLASLLQAKGWDTAAFVSSAVLKKRFGLDHGFTVYDDQMPRPGNAQQVLEDAERRAGDTVDRAVQWLDSRTEKPFLPWVHLYDPHAPYDPPAPFREQYKGRLYDGEIAYADREVGRLMEAVHRRSAPDKTLVAVLSDHGESLGEHGEASHGVFLYDATLRIVFMLSGAGVPAGVRLKPQARTIDLLPTILELTGVSAPAGIEGASLAPLFSGKNAPTAVSYAETLYPRINLGWAELRGVRTNEWKYIRAPKPELYDLSRDPRETDNVLAEHPAEVRKLEAQLSAASRSTGVEKVDTTPVDAHTMDQLKSLGYLSGSESRSYEMNGQGVDPKDRVEVLKLLEGVVQPGSGLPTSRRIEMLQQAVRLDPANPLLYHLLGAQLEKAGRYDDAMKLYRAGIARGVVDSRLHTRLADLLVRSGKKAEAIPEYEAGAKLNPADVASQANLGSAYLELGRLDDAERVFKAVATIDPSSAAAQNGLGLVAIQRQDGNAARAYLEKAVELDPDMVEAQLNLGVLYKMAGDKQHARASFEQFLARAPAQQYKEVIPKVRAELADLQ